MWFRGLVGAQEPRGDEEVVEANTQLREPEQSRRKVQLGAPWQRPGDGRGPGGGVDHRQAGISGLQASRKAQDTFLK